MDGNLSTCISGPHGRQQPRDTIYQRRDVKTERNAPNQDPHQRSLGILFYSNSKLSIHFLYLRYLSLSKHCTETSQRRASRSCTKMVARRLLFGVACCGLCSSAMASNVGLTSVKLHSAISAECTERQHPNFVFSPYSVLGAFHMAQLGAEGETRKQMDDLVPSDESFKLPAFDVPSMDGGEVVKVDTANRIYVSNALASNKYFVNFDKEVRLAMDSDAETVDFNDPVASSENINSFVEQKTRGHIQHLVDSSSLTPMTRMVLISALYFKAPWNNKFDQGMTSEGLFHARTFSGKDPQVVKFMRNTFKNGFTYLKEGDVTAFSLPYADYRLRMHVYLPDDIEAFESRIAKDPQRLEDIASRLERAHLPDRELELAFPKFKLSAEDNKLDLVQLFKQMGADHMFEPGLADFSGMTGDRDLHVSFYVHQADIEVDEDGTEASAATAMGIMAMSMPLPKTTLEVVVDKPFIFQVRYSGEDGTSYILFSGRIADAKAAQ